MAFYKNFHLSPFDSLRKKDVVKGLKNSLHIKNLQKKVQIKTSGVKSKRLDDFHLKPSFIKIDVQGHEYDCIRGSLKTIKKYKPIIMLEYDSKSVVKIYKILTNSQQNLADVEKSFMHNNILTL